MCGGRTEAATWFIKSAEAGFLAAYGAAAHCFFRQFEDENPAKWAERGASLGEVISHLLRSERARGEERPTRRRLREHH